MFLGSRIVGKTGKNPSEISRGRWPCGRKPPVKRRTRVGQVFRYVCVFLWALMDSFCCNGIVDLALGKGRRTKRVPILGRKMAG